MQPRAYSGSANECDGPLVKVFSEYHGAAIWAGLRIIQRGSDIMGGLDLGPLFWEHKGLGINLN